jgi:hypothetical protein
VYHISFCLCEWYFVARADLFWNSYIIALNTCQNWTLLLLSFGRVGINDTMFVLVILRRRSFFFLIKVYSYFGWYEYSSTLIVIKRVKIVYYMLVVIYNNNLYQIWRIALFTVNIYDEKCNCILTLQVASNEKKGNGQIFFL